MCFAIISRARPRPAGRVVHRPSVRRVLHRLAGARSAGPVRAHRRCMQKTIVKTPTPQDFLALVPQLVGFLPAQSLVLVAFRGNRTCGALRFNLPSPEAGPQELRRIAGALLGTLCKIPGVDALVPVTYTDESIGDDPATDVAALPQGAFLRAILTRAEQSGFLVRDALCVAADGWASYLDAAPVGGRSLPVPTEARIAKVLPKPAGALTSAKSAPARRANSESVNVVTADWILARAGVDRPHVLGCRGPRRGQGV